MEVSCKYLTDNPTTTFIPREMFEVPEIGEKWLTVNFGRYPPIQLIRSLDHNTCPGLYGMYIDLLINPHSTNINVLDILHVGKYNMVIMRIAG